MIGLQAVSQQVEQFLTQTLGAYKVKVIGISPGNGGWQADAETTEESVYIRALGRPMPTVYARYRYTVHLNEDLEVLFYARQEEHSSSGV